MIASGQKIEILPLSPFEIRPFSHFVLAGDLTYLASDSAIAIGVEADGKPAGLALAHFVRHAAVRVAAFTVEESLRGSGIGGRLYAQFENELVARGVVLADILASNPEPFLEKRGWYLGARLAAVYTFSKRVGEAPWLRTPMAVPPEYELFPWLEHSAADREQALRLMAEDPVAQRLDPFHNPGAPFGPSSNGIRHHGELAGWCVAHRMGASTLQYSSVYVAPKLRRTVAPMILLGHSIREQLRRSDELPFGVQAVPPELPEIERFATKRLAPWADRFEQIHVWWKQFGSEAAR
jgi:GNAT superfamily N-acetyltransferase